MTETPKSNVGTILIQSLALIAAGLLGNHFKFPIFLNIDFIFGSIFAMLALQIFGPGIGIAAAAIISGYTFILWHHPYAIIIMTMETAVVGWLMKRYRIGMVLADAIYWIILGMAQVYLFYHVIMRIPMNSTLIVMVKQAVNGITNALIAQLVFTGFIALSRSRLISYREIIYNLLIFFVLCPSLITLAISSRTDFTEIDQRVRNVLIQDSQWVKQFLEAWVSKRSLSINNLAEMAATKTPEEIQPFLEYLKKSDENFLRIGLLDKEATITAYYPLVDELGKANIGKNFADRPFIPVLKQTLKPLLSEVVMGRIGVPKPMTTMLAPVVVDGKYNGYVTGILGMDQIMQTLQKIAERNGSLFTLIDKYNNVILTNRTDQQAIKKFNRSGGSLVKLDSQISQWVPVIPSHSSVMERWKQSSYIAETAIGSIAEWKIILEQPVAPYQKTLYENYTGKFMQMFLILIASMVLAEWINRKTIKTIETLRLTTHDMAERLSNTNGTEIVWPKTVVMETHHLITNFQEMANSLADQFHELQKTQDALNRAYTEVEMQVHKRTVELHSTNEALTTEITERRQAEELLRENEARLRAITDSAQDAIIMMDPNGIVSFWNVSAERILGYPKEEAVGKNLHQFIAPSKYHESFHSTYPMFQQTGLGAAVGRTLDLEALRNDGVMINIQLSLSAVHMRDGWHAIGILRDVTHQKQAEEELRALNLELQQAMELANHMAMQAEQANAAKSEFLANMSHEIRTPMNGVIGMTGLLLDTNLNDEQRSYAEIVNSSAESLLGIINDILDFSKIEAKKLDLELLDFNLSAILNDFTAALTVQAAQKGLEIICRTDPDVPALLRGDPGRLRQILTNLAGNAIKFTHLGRISIHVELIENIEDDVLLRFGVNDTGIGIPENKMDMIFANFTQADASTTRRYGGTGLGLAISKQLAELMGGRMGVDSEIGKGSEFWFTVRFKKQKASTLEEICHPEAARHDRQAGLMEEDSTTTKADSSNAMNTFVGSNARILVAEDNITNQQVAMGILKKLGLRADAVANGAEVIDAIKNLPYNLILMDVQMPVMDGLEATRRIREMETKRAALSGTTTDPSSKRSYIPIIAMTAHAMQGDREKCLAAGMNDYLSKPVSPQALVENLKKWLPNASQEDQSIARSIDIKQLQVKESSDTDLPVWNKSKLFERLMDDEELVTVILEGFLSDIPKQILALKGYLESGDTSGTERQAHTIKGASANISAERLRAAAFEVEKAARANNSAAMGMLIQELETQFDRLKECMQQDNK